MSSRMIDDILAGLELFEAIVGHLTAAKAVAEHGGDLTAEQRAALDAANVVREARLLAAIDARIGPDADDAAASVPNVQPPAEAAAAGTLAATVAEQAAALLEKDEQIRRLTDRLAAEQAALPPDTDGPPGPAEP